MALDPAAQAVGVAGVAGLGGGDVHPHRKKHDAGIAYTLPYFSGGVIMYVVYQRFGTTPRLAWLSMGFICASALVRFQD